jgi:hypothetical protein
MGLLKTRRRQAEEALIGGQDTIEIGDCDVEMIDIEVEGVAEGD